MRARHRRGDGQLRRLAAEGATLADLLRRYLPHRQNLLAALQQTRALRNDIDDLIARYNNAGIRGGAWRMNTLRAISNIPHDVHATRVATSAPLEAQAVAQRAAVTWRLRGRRRSGPVRTPRPA